MRFRKKNSIVWLCHANILHQYSQCWTCYGHVFLETVLCISHIPFMIDLNHTGKKRNLLFHISAHTVHHIISWSHFLHQAIHTHSDRQRHSIHTCFSQYTCLHTCLHTYIPYARVYTHIYTNTNTNTQTQTYGVKYYQVRSLSSEKSANTSQHCILEMLIHMWNTMTDGIPL